MPLQSQQTQVEKLLRSSEVLALTGMSRSTLYRLTGAGQFPAPLQLGSTNRWPESEIAEFIDAMNGHRAARGR